ARAFAQAALLDTQGAQPFGAGPLEELQVVGIEDDAAGVGVFPIDANGELEGHRQVKRACSRATVSCKCAMELAVEKRTKSWVCAVPKSRPGVTATWARFITSKAKSQLPWMPSFWHAFEQSAQ